MGKGLSILKYALLITSLLLTFILIYKPHFDYQFPFHSDEWIHLAYATYIMEPHTDPNEFPALNVNPYFGTGEKDFEVGFHVFLAAIFSAVKVDPVLTFKFLPALSASIAAFILFVFIFSLTKNFYAGILAILFFTSLRTDVTILGIQFFLPLTAAIPLIFCFFILLTKGVDQQRWLYLSFAGLILLTVFIIHPVSAIFFAPITIIYLLFNIKKIWSNKIGTIALLIIPSFSVVAFFTFLWKGSIMLTIQNALGYFVFERGKTLAYERFYYLPRLFSGPIFNNGIFFENDMTYLFLIGLFVCFYYAHKRIFALWFFFSLVLTAVFYHYHFTYFAQYQRILYYGLVAMAPIAAIGLYTITTTTINLLKRFAPVFKSEWIMQRLWLAVTIFFIITISLHTSRVVDYDSQQFYRIINWEEYNGILSLKMLNITKSVVLTWPAFGSAITPTSGNYVVEHTLQFNTQKPSFYFLRSSCAEQREMISRYKANYIIYQYDWDCPGYQKLYDNGILKLYKV